MPLNEVLSIALLVAVCGTMMLGFPVAYTLAGVSILFALFGAALGVFDIVFFHAIPSRFFGVMSNEVLVAVPLFVFMGVMLERSRVAEELLTTMGQCFGSLRGGLGISVTVVGMLLAASTGIVGATVVTMGLLSLPSMLKAGYDHKLACGTICASGTLGQIIPPSIALVILGDSLSGAYSEAQLAKGNYLVEPFSVIDLFAGALVPGLMLGTMYVLYLVGVALLKPNTCPAYYETGVSMRDLTGRIFRAFLPPVFLVIAVLGSILGGTCHADRSGVFRRCRCNVSGAAAGTADQGRYPECHPLDNADHGHGLLHPAGRVPVLPDVSGIWRR